MNWFSWLSMAALEPSVAYEYGLLFTQHELEEEDMVYFNHEFLQSMGIVIAKHRLEILKLAKRENGRAPYVQRLFASIKKTNRKLTTFVQGWLHRQTQNQTHDINNHSRALIVHPPPSSSRRRISMPSFKRGGAGAGSGGILGCFSTSVAVKNQKMKKKKKLLLLGPGDGHLQQQHNNPSRSPIRLMNSPYEMRSPLNEKQIVPANFSWESLFQDLKPT